MKNHEEIPTREEVEELVSNSEVIERQLYYLATVQSYLEQQLEQVKEAVQKLLIKQEND